MGDESWTSYKGDAGGVIRPSEFKDASPELRVTLNRTGYLRRHKPTHEVHTDFELDRITGNLELTKGQRGQVENTLQILDLERLGLRKDLVIFSLCALVARQDGRLYHPNRSDENNDPLFVDQAKQLRLKKTPIPKEWILSCMSKLERQTDLRW